MANASASILPFLQPGPKPQVVNDPVQIAAQRVQDVLAKLPQGDEPINTNSNGKVIQTLGELQDALVNYVSAKYMALQSDSNKKALESNAKVKEANSRVKNANARANAATEQAKTDQAALNEFIKNSLGMFKKISGEIMKINNQQQ
jgi:sulfur carrier protein ThiS